MNNSFIESLSCLIFHHLFMKYKLFNFVCRENLFPQFEDIPADAILELFGKTFFEFCQDSGYDKILQVLGARPKDFLQVNWLTIFAQLENKLKSFEKENTGNCESKQLLSPEN